ncbi:hypothetical protein D3OALGB2SA_1036 [Olavius algarvensis associated proteobacterium Delta 3]|nr:hypothetical protein D3OALGB2SA_1036 [Olavius algarvensis associated proteobacterium Delta 3]
MKKFWMFCVLWMLVWPLVTGCSSGSNNSQAALKKKQSEAIRGVGEAYLAEGRISAALREFLKAEELYGNDHLLHEGLGLAYMAKGRMEQAIYHFKKALAIEPDYPAGQNNLGVAYMKNGELDKAIAIFEELSDNVLYAAPHFPMYNLGRIYFTKRNYALAEQWFRMAVDTSPRFVEAQQWIGRTYMARGRVYDAIAAYQEGINMAELYYPIYFDIGEAYRVTGDIPNALAAYGKVLELAPKDSDLSKDVKEIMATLK